jgi:hypothetical protein
MTTANSMEIISEGGKIKEGGNTGTFFLTISGTIFDKYI